MNSLAFIYYLQNPVTGEIFYVGATKISLTNRLRTHYQHLREFERGLRKSNRRYEYLLKLRPDKATIHLLEIVTDLELLDERECFYIKLMRKAYPNLTNMTDGGKGKHTTKYYTEQELEEYSKKLTQGLKGKAKPNGFATNLSKQRKGINNPAAKELDRALVCFKNSVPVRMFKYGFEVNDFLQNKYGYGNVFAAFKRGSTRVYNYTWLYIDECDLEVQDIVRTNYESN